MNVTYAVWFGSFNPSKFLKNPWKLSLVKCTNPESYNNNDDNNSNRVCLVEPSQIDALLVRFEAYQQGLLSPKRGIK